MSARKSVLILGAGMVTKPIVHYLANTCHYNVILGSRTLDKAKQLIEGAKGATAIKIDIENPADVAKVDELARTVDALVSMLPYIYHAQVCAIAIKYKKHFLTTSYVSDAMRALEPEAKKAGIIIINECGVDPGTDHMSAQKLMDRVHAEGGRIVSFKSFCGGLPAPEDNNNPLGYKFSWAPRGVLLASRNSALFLKDGKEVTIPGAVLFDNYELFKVSGLDTQLEGYPNRDSIQYLDVYGLRGECKTIVRGTYRNPGWCTLVKKFADLGYLDVAETNLSSTTYGKLTRSLIKKLANSEGKKVDFSKPLPEQLGSLLALPTTHHIITTFGWLGLFDDNAAIPPNTKTNLDALCAAMLSRMQYAEGERDMLVMQHTFEVEYPKEKKKRIYTSKLLDFGIKNGDSSMSRTVSLPVAIATRLVLEGKLDHLRGKLVIPTLPELYNPILKELESLNIKFIENLESETSIASL